MSNKSENRQEEYEKSDASQEERMNVADEVCRKACEDSGLAVASWQNFDGWKEYVEGQIGESQLTERAKDEVQEFSGIFGKYVVIDKNEESRHQEEEEKKKERAKQANKIYREVCREEGLTVCFFRDFSSWSDFVEGRITELMFRERAKQEADKIRTDPNSSAA
jgi:predicted solute-binding protein